MTQAKPATEATIAANKAVYDQLPFGDTTDFDNARKGLIAEATGQIKNDKGEVVWDIDRWKFLDGEAPDTVNPSLWRQAKLNSLAGIFKVTDRIYQARGFDLSVQSFLRTDNGWIVVDPPISCEPMDLEYKMLCEHVEDLPVVAVIHTHSHIDHFGGVRAVIDDEKVARGEQRVVAPVGFLEESVSENVMLGNAMSRRKMYMYGELVGYGPQGSVGAGLGQMTSAGRVTLLPPTDVITETGQELTIDGLRIVFQNAPGAEAPAELAFYLPEQKALCGAEILTHVNHNVYTLRGAKIRDSLVWSKHLNVMLDKFGDADVQFSSHHWPTWGNENIRDLIKGQRDLYRYMHDETVRLANAGFTPEEIAEQITLPEDTARRFANRGYYGSLSHNTKSTYVYYLGWFDANPSNLNPLPPVETAVKMVEYMGGADAVIAKAREDFDKGEYRWVAQALKHVVYADDTNTEARELLADTYEQLGYQTENGTWRNFYLTGAVELRRGVQEQIVTITDSPDSVQAMETSMFIDYLAMRLRGPEVGDLKATFNLILPDTDEKFLLELGNGVLHHTEGTQADDADATITFPRAVIDDIVLSRTTLKEAAESGKVTADGNTDAFVAFTKLLDDFDLWFHIVTP